jgi:hypothetical protein
MVSVASQNQGSGTMIICRMAYLSGKPNRTGLTGHDRQRPSTDLHRSRWTFLVRDGELQGSVIANVCPDFAPG